MGTEGFTLHGKVILMGEHSVVFGAPALAVPLPRGTDFFVTPLGKSNRIQLDPDPVSHHGAIEKILATEISHEGFSLSCPRGLPAGAGLGMSALLSVALVRAAARFSRVEKSEGELHEIARKLETHFHGNPSGIDDTTVWYGVPVLLQKPRIAMAVPFPHTLLEPSLALIRPPALPLLVGDSMERIATRVMVERLGKRLTGPGRATFVERMGASIERFCAAWGQEKYDAMGKEMNAAQEEYRALGLSTERIDAMVETARRVGAWGAKLSGSGGGGVVVATGSPKALSDLESAWSSMGCDIISSVD
ncbi:mevalonate kinase [Myxococcota bacterium]|nr:mevalonate kinase [Myxococcota bacterium]